MKTRGFTLIELLIVLVIIGILVTLAVPQYQKFKEKAIAAEAIRTIGIIRNAQFGYKMETGTHTYNLSLLDITVDEYGPGGLGTGHYWEYSMAVVGDNSFAIVAYRTGENHPYSNTYIILDWDENRSIAGGWMGTHPFVPRN